MVPLLKALYPPDLPGILAAVTALVILFFSLCIYFRDVIKSSASRLLLRILRRPLPPPPPADESPCMRPVAFDRNFAALYVEFLVVIVVSAVGSFSRG
jgi:hypothetical protein